MKQLPKKYNHKETEAKWQAYWREHNIYKWHAERPHADNFVIDTPPPTVSGLLHMGHVFSYCQADFVARFQRMSGKNVFYPMGFDDNGLPTERLVEKVKKIKGNQMPRAEFIAHCEEVVAEAEQEFRALFDSIALSVDWDEHYQTISPHCTKMAQMSFLDLYNKSEIYRKEQPMLWDPIDSTALAQADLEDKEKQSYFNDLRFYAYDTASNAKLEPITIATTRPELLAACVAVLYHPDDERYQHLAGKSALTPLFGAIVPLIADELVEMDKGSGLVMCCTYGDQTDIIWQQKHDLPIRVILDKYGKIRLDDIVDAPDNIAEQLNGLKAEKAREKITQLLEASGDLLERKQITHNVKVAERSGSPLEILVTPQWFVRITDKKSELLDKANQINWYPEYMKIRLEQWINGLSWDWCISRQRYFGVPFPIWYSKRAGEEGKILVPSPEQLPVDPFVDLPDGYKRDEVTPDPDVMDTWATSSISPQLSSYGLNDSAAINPDRHSKLFPADLRPQAHEIIRTWAFYTIAKAHLHQNTVPWHNIMISGWCLAEDKTKMSKSKGNVVTPTTLIEEKGSDVVRYWASTSNLGADTAYSEVVLKIGKKLVNKLWNACKFASLHLEKLEQAGLYPSDDDTTASAMIANGRISETLDIWIIARLHDTIRKANTEFGRYEYAKARDAIEDFFWNDFCDNYLELVKSRAYNNEATEYSDQQLSAFYAIYYSVDAILRLFAPYVPHICDELYSHIFEDKFSQIKSLQTNSNWPNEQDYQIKSDKNNIDLCGNLAIEILAIIRKAKSEAELSIKTPVKLLKIIAESNSQINQTHIDAIITDLSAAGGVEEFQWLKNHAKQPLNEQEESFISIEEYNLKIMIELQLIPHEN